MCHEIRKGLVALLSVMLFVAPAYALVAGDVDDSGSVDVMDIQLIINAALRIPVSAPTDLDHSGSTDALDVQLVINGALLVSIDTDTDGLCDMAEARLGTSPTNPDSDDDGVDDGQEILDGTDPLVPNVVTPPVRINEFVASNTTGLTDEDGDYSDWIELYNPGSETVSLEGWSLTDKASTPGMWTFPAVTIAPDSYLVVFASGKNRRVPGNSLHTNLKLSKDGEYLGLYRSPTEPAVSTFSPKFPGQSDNYSYGVYQTGPEFRYFSVPTPGAPNTGTAYIGFAATPTFSHLRGFYDASFSLTLTTGTDEATIRYTSDGTEPTETHGTVYSVPVPVSASTVVRACAYKEGYLMSSVATNSYILGAPAALKSLPAVSLVADEEKTFYGEHGIMYVKGGYYSGTSPNSIKWKPNTDLDYNHFLRLHYPLYTDYPGTRRWERPASMEVFYTGTDPAANTGIQADCGIRIHGGDSVRGKYASLGDTRHPFSQYFNGPDWMYHFVYKTSFRLYFRSDYGASSLDFPLFQGSPLQKQDTIVLRGGHNDWVNPFIKDELARRLQGDQGYVYARGNLMNLFVNGVWKGYYNVADFLNSQYLENWFNSANEWDVITQDYIYPDQYEVYEAQQEGASQWPPVRDGDDVAWKALMDFAKNNDLTIPANYDQIATQMDMVNFIDYLILQLYIADYDWLHTNWIVARERKAGAKFIFLLWDAEKSMEGDGMSDGTINYNGFIRNGGGRGGLNGQGDDSPIARLYQKLKPNTTFKQLFRQRIDLQFSEGNALSKSNLTARFTQLRDELEPMIAYTYNLHKDTSPYVPSATMNSYILDTWIPQREAIILGIFAAEGF